MATYDELSRKYVEKILNAIRQDNFQTTIRITSYDFKRSATFAVLKEIRSEINGVVYENTQRPLSDTDKNDLYRQISEKLGLPSYRQLSENKIIKATSNDDLTDLLDAIDSILNK